MLSFYLIEQHRTQAHFQGNALIEAPNRQITTISETRIGLLIGVYENCTLIRFEKPDEYTSDIFHHFFFCLFSFRTISHFSSFPCTHLGWYHIFHHSSVCSHLGRYKKIIISLSVCSHLGWYQVFWCRARRLWTTYWWECILFLCPQQVCNVRIIRLLVRASVKWREVFRKVRKYCADHLQAFVVNDNGTLQYLRFCLFEMYVSFVFLS